jgi:hypothetical protein
VIVFRNGARRFAAIGWVSPVDSSSCEVGGRWLMRTTLIVVAALAATTAAIAMRTTSYRAVTVPAPRLAVAPAVEEQPPEKAVVGTLESVNAGATQIVVSTPGGRQTFTVDSGAIVRQGSQTIKAGELQTHKGERVKVRYREARGVKRAAWIVLAAPPSARKAKHAPSA